MSDDPTVAELEGAMRRINEAWLDGRPRDLLPLIHPEMVMRYPGFVGRSIGSAAFVEGFVDFVESATIDELRQTEPVVDLVDDTGVVSYEFELRYTQGGQQHRSTGRDLWLFHRKGGEWLAVWRTMLDLTDEIAN